MTHHRRKSTYQGNVYHPTKKNTIRGLVHIDSINVALLHTHRGGQQSCGVCLALLARRGQGPASIPARLRLFGLGL